MEPVHVTDYGVFLGKHSERLVVRKGKEVLAEHPLLHVEQVLVSGRGVSLSADLVEECSARGIPITFLTPGGKPYARVASAALTATVLTRREQVAAYGDGRGARLARALATGKLKNQANLLRYFGKYCKARRPTVHNELNRRAGEIALLGREIEALPGENVEALRAALMNREGRAGAHYWAGVACLLEGKCAFSGREHRGAEDPVNAALNYGYGILQSQVWTAVTLAGLEPHGGFIHVDRPGRPSLVLDLMEEFRQPVVDRALLAAWGRGWKAELEAPHGEDDAAPRLTREARGDIGARVRERLESVALYGKKRQTLKNVIQLQARHLAVVLRGEAEYAPYVAPW